MQFTLAEQGILPKVQCNPLDTDEFGNTIAMLLAKAGKVPPLNWYHTPSLQNSYGKTVAMYLAQNSIVPSKRWQHDPQLKSRAGNTVATFLTRNNIVPPKQWYCDGLQIPHFDVQTVRLNQTCPICLEDGLQPFVIPSCSDKHAVCIDCFRQICRNQASPKCPICMAPF